MRKMAVVALGGNALLRGDQAGTIEQQEDNAYDTLKNLVYLIREGYHLVITHGNGPQVGNLVMQNDAGEQLYNLPQMPLDVCVAETQGQIGYMLERMLRKVLKEEGIDREVVTLMTQIVVDINDPAFQNPTKRVGRICSKEEADKMSQAKGWIYKESPKTDGGYRRVVASPNPIQVINENVIKSLASLGVVVIAVGGGGIPVYIDENENIRPAEAVIDKDLASALLASRIRAHEFYILTDVPYVYLDYKKPEEKILEFINRNDAEKYLADGKFGEGSMAPKIRAALNFIETGGLKSVITEATKLEDRTYGTKITMEYED